MVTITRKFLWPPTFKPKNRRVTRLSQKIYHLRRYEKAVNLTVHLGLNLSHLKIILRPDLPAFTAPTFDNICEDPKVLFDRITAWAQNYLSGCRSGAAARIEERMQKWKIWMFRRAGCGYRWRTSDDRRNNGHFLAAGVYTIDNRCNPDFVDVNGNDCEQQALWCHTERWTTEYVFAPTGLHLLPLTGMKTEFGIQTAYSCPQCGCTGRINTDNSRKPGPALYPAP